LADGDAPTISTALYDTVGGSEADASHGYHCVILSAPETEHTMRDLVLRAAATAVADFGSSMKQMLTE
jgi:hypothetical protein